jgi:predicted DNA-binding transcriptional regulator AlpA
VKAKATPPPDAQEFFTPAELIKYLRMGKSTFYALRAKGKGPDVTRLSERKVMYRREDVERWLARRRQRLQPKRSNHGSNNVAPAP